MEVSLCFFLVSFHGSDEDGAKIGGRRRCRRKLGHGDKLFAAGGMRRARLRGDRERENRYRRLLVLPLTSWAPRLVESIPTVMKKP